MAQSSTKRIPFSNQGIVQKLDLSQLQDGQYQYLLNIVSEQEGNISPRNGYQDIAGSFSGGSSTIHSMLAVRLNPTASPEIYFGEGINIHRSIVTGASFTDTQIASSIANANTRFGMTQFKTDQYNNTGTVYIGTGFNDVANNVRGMIKDTYLNQNAAYMTNYIGILPPFFPAFTSVAAPTIVPVPALGTITTNTRYSSTITSVVPPAPQTTGSDQYLIQPATITGLQSGMFVRINGAQNGVIGDIDATAGTFTIALASAPANGQTIIALYDAVTTSTGTDASDIIAASAVNLALSGVVSNGYNSADNIHFSVLLNPTSEATGVNIASITYRVYPNASSSGAYEFTQVIATAAPVVPSPDPSWIEIDIPKNTFTANGVGSGNNSWVDINQIEVAVKPIDSALPFSFAVGQPFGVGGGGPNSGSSPTLTPYDYVFTYQNPFTGAESNPSPIQKPEAALFVTKQAIKVTVYGSDNTGFNSGVQHVEIYRRGGSFVDGLFRKVGTVTNPGLSGGSAVQVSFRDNIDDQSISNAVVAQFDNDAPVTSDLNQEYQFPLSGTAQNYNGAVGLTGLSVNLRTILTPGTEILVGASYSQNQETIVVNSVSTSTFESYFQYFHAAGEPVTWSTNAGIACDLTLAAMDCLWLAGNPQNPNMLYRSKTGRPESFPIINEATGNAHVISISSPDNPINGIAEYNSEIVCLCQNGIYTVRLDNGVIRGPFKTPSNRGLLYKGAWGYVDNEIWFLAHDGIYSWSGGVANKVTLPVDFLFNNKSVNGISPYDTYGTAIGVPFFAHLSNIVQKNNEIFFNYVDSTGAWYVLRYNKVFPRYSLDQLYDASSIETFTYNGFTVKTTKITCMCIDRATGDIFAAKSTKSAGPVNAAYLIYYNQPSFYNDGGTSAPGTTPIYYDGIGKYYDMGLPFTKKQFTDIAVELTSGQVTANDIFKCQLFYDYAATPDSVDQFTITPSAIGRNIIPLSLQQTGSPATSLGKEARAVQWEIFGTSTAFNFFHGFALTFNPLSDIIKGRITDWTNLGHPYDKRLDTVTIEYDNGNSQVLIYLDLVTGIFGNQNVFDTQTLTLPASVGRALVTIPLLPDTIAKMVRLRPVVPASNYEIFDWSFPELFKYPADRVYFTDYSDEGYEYEKRFFQLYINCDTNGYNVPVNIIGDGAVLQTITVSGTASNRMQPIPIDPDKIAKLIRLVADVTFLGANPGSKFQLFSHKFDYEKLPKPTVLSTEWNDFGYDYLKWAEQIVLDVNTNGFDIPCQVWGDGVLKQSVTVNSTQATRSVNITLNPGITFQQMRLVINPAAIPMGGRFQLWEYKPIFQPADKGPVYHSFDWDSLGHPYDKKIAEVTIEFETQGANVDIAIDTLTGINGNTQTLDAITLTLNSTARGFKTFPLPETVCKMVRIRSLGTNGGGTHSPDLKMWGYKFGNTIPYPADITEFTEWNDLKSSCDKIFRGVGIQVDTGGVACTIALDIDGAQVQTWSITTTSQTRQIFLSAQNNVELEGRLYRLRFIPGTGGKAQLFGEPAWDCPKDACPFVFWDTYNQAFGSAGFTVIKQVFFDYKCAVPVTLKFYNQQGSLFYTKTLPAHTTRAAERFYLPSVNNGVLNKSKKHRMTVETTDVTQAFKFYRDASRIMYLNLSANQQEGYFKEITWEQLPLQT